MSTEMIKLLLCKYEDALEGTNILKWMNTIF